MSNLENIKNVAKVLLYTDIQKTQIDFIVTHPFTNTPIVMIKEKGVHELINLTQGDNLKKWRYSVANDIEKAENTIYILLMMNKPYWLLFINLCRDYISKQELGTILNMFWSQVENISGDTNVSPKELVELFKRSDKTTLMEADELERFNDLPKTITLYRGVTGYNRDKKQALSWTDNIEQAKWFMDRFDVDNKELWTIKAPKEAILACYNSENEFIVDMSKLSRKIEIEKY